MAHLGGQIYDSIKDAVKYSSGEFGLIATYKDANGKLFYFINGKPVISIKAPKK
ncbi:hypothetical protein [Flavobacterium sp. W22_SRS_FP1]|uniref:hypothetical protein n=1 Tax=Flavobacterium sp. W22_SRS_FP1 TaxID=3240276 RepID=UPI003F931BCE